MSDLLAWPEKLPLPVIDAYRIEPLDGVARTPMTSGPARQRQRYTQTPTRIPLSWHFSAREFALFEAWFTYKARRGATWFVIPLLAGLGLVDHEVRFAGAGEAPYSARPTRPDADGAARWIVTTALEVRKRHILSEPALDVLLKEDLPGLLSAIDAWHHTVHTVLPRYLPGDRQ